MILITAFRDAFGEQMKYYRVTLKPKEVTIKQKIRYFFKLFLFDGFTQINKEFAIIYK